MDYRTNFECKKIEINNILLNKIMYWKILIILIIVILTIIVFLFGQSVVFKESTLSNENDEKTDTILKQFLTGGVKKINVVITKDKFDTLIIPENMNLYYFPDECPNYDMDIFLRVEKDGAEKYYVPEKNSLLLIDKEHKWTNSFDKYIMWKK